MAKPPADSSAPDSPPTNGGDVPIRFLYGAEEQAVKHGIDIPARDTLVVLGTYRYRVQDVEHDYDKSEVRIYLRLT